MANHQVRLINPHRRTNEKTERVVKAENPVLAKVIQERRRVTERRQDQASYVEKIASKSRVIIIEGISGSGKDALQTHLKKKLADRDVYDFSEGEVLHSWKQLQIQGVSELRVKFMKRFANHIREVIDRDEQAVFLLNRFHLSTYASTVHQQPTLAAEYNEIIDVLKLLPVHIFILQLDESEMEKRSLHPERSGAWQRFQQQILESGGFRGRLIRQQELILEAAKRQQLPYSVIKVSYEPEIAGGQVRISDGPSMFRPQPVMKTSDAKASRNKRPPSRTF